jgi:ABC-type multidrug transport system ATPase subunit
VIAHRLSTIRNATRILLFDGGRVIESGTFDELVAKGGRFAELARAQFMVQETNLETIQKPHREIVQAIVEANASGAGNIGGATIET